MSYISIQLSIVVMKNVIFLISSPSSVCTSFPVATSNTLMMPSMAPLATNFISALFKAEKMGSKTRVFDSAEHKFETHTSNTEGEFPSSVIGLMQLSSFHVIPADFSRMTTRYNMVRIRCETHTPHINWARFNCLLFFTTLEAPYSNKGIHGTCRDHWDTIIPHINREHTKSRILYNYII